MTIYMISYEEDMINEEHGYFSSKESAERYVRNLDAEKLGRYREGALWCLKTMNPDLEYTIATGSPIPDISGRDRYVLTCTETFTTLADALSYWETLPPGMRDRHFIVCRRVLPDDSAEWFKV